MAIIEANGLVKSYGPLQVLKGVSLSINQGEMVSIVGSSGAGKSTLLHILGTIDHPDKGTYHLMDTEVFKLRGRKLATFRNKNIGFIFQFHMLLPEFSALENVCIPGFLGGKNKKDVQQEAKNLLEMLGMGERLEHKPGQLSGGEQQRVAVARALINKPSLVLADEPTGNLDSTNALELQKLFNELRKQFNLTFIIVTHNDQLASFSDRILRMKDGWLV